MLNDPPPRRPHPLEQKPTPPAEQGERPRQIVTLHIPTVKPHVTYALVAINLAVFVIRALSPELDSQIAAWGANQGREVLVRGEYHRLFTAMFLHASIYDAFGRFALENSLHLIFNVYMIYTVGRFVEPFFGHLRFALVYLLGGLGGSVLSALLNDPRVYSLGASGAVFAILGAEFVYLYQHRKLLGAAARAQMRYLAFLVLINLFYGIASSAGLGQFRVDNWGHAGGLVGGLALSWFIAPFYIPRRHPEIPDELIVEDINPLNRRYWAVSLYVAALLALLIVATLATRN